jgi:hypothetical protein
MDNRVYFWSREAIPAQQPVDDWKAKQTTMSKKEES